MTDRTPFDVVAATADEVEYNPGYPPIKQGPEPNERCSGCGGKVARYGDPCRFCEAWDDHFSGPEWEAFDEACRAIRSRLVERRTEELANVDGRMGVELKPAVATDGGREP